MKTTYSIAVADILYKVLLIIPFICSTYSSYAQKPVTGNGKVIEQVRPLSQFKSVSLDFVAHLTIVNGETPSFHIVGEDNILPHIGTQVRGGTLYISQDRWIEPTQEVKIRVGTPFTSELKTSGYSNVVVENAKGPRLRFDIGVGKVKAYGNADRVQVRTKTGEIDLSTLESKYVDVAISSHGVVKVAAISELVTDIASRGTVIYEGNPSIKRKRDNKDGKLIHKDNYVEPDKIEISYIALTLVNNSRKRVALRVEGPNVRNFSYGFSMSSKDKRREDWPVGTRLYQESGLLPDRLLLTITESMDGQYVDLFTGE